jgi:hypothetical protein
MDARVKPALTPSSGARGYFGPLTLKNDTGAMTCAGLIRTVEAACGRC